MRSAALASLLLAMSLSNAASAASWITSWTASPQPTWSADFALPTGVPDALRDVTVRQVMRVSLGGRRLRIVLSNAYGNAPLVVGAVHVAIAGEGSAILAGSDRVVTFGGEAGTTVPAGAPMESDPVDLVVQPLQRVTVSLHLPQETRVATFHWDGRETAWLVDGDRVAAECLASDRTSTARFFVSALRVEAGPQARAVVVLGDSITDGNGATVGADARWPDLLASRLAARRVAVLNAGISGARLLGDRMGENAFARFDRDVLSERRATTLVVLLGINDIAWPGTAFDPDGEMPTAATLIAAYRQLIERAHAHGLRIVGATLTPFEGALEGSPLAGYYSPKKDAVRREVNAWMRGSEAFDAVIDFDAALRDPRHPSRLRDDVDSGDHLHPGDAGGKAMADAIDLDALLGR